MIVCCTMKRGNYWYEAMKQPISTVFDESQGYSAPWITWSQYVLQQKSQEVSLGRHIGIQILIINRFIGLVAWKNRGFPFKKGLSITPHKTHRIAHIFAAGLFPLLLPNPLESAYILPG